MLSGSPPWRAAGRRGTVRLARDGAGRLWRAPSWPREAVKKSNSLTQRRKGAKLTRKNCLVFFAPSRLCAFARKLFSSLGIFHTFRRPCQVAGTAIPPEHVRHRLIRHPMAEVGPGSRDPIVSLAGVLSGHTYDQGFGFTLEGRSAPIGSARQGWQPCRSRQATRCGVSMARCSGCGVSKNGCRPLPSAASWTYSRLMLIRLFRQATADCVSIPFVCSVYAPFES